MVPEIRHIANAPAGAEESTLHSHLDGDPEIMGSEVSRKDLAEVMGVEDHRLRSRVPEIIEEPVE
jgi:hypothetical protein